MRLFTILTALSVTIGLSTVAQAQNFGAVPEGVVDELVDKYGDHPEILQEKIQVGSNGFRRSGRNGA